LVRDGLVTREPDPTDRRVTRIKLTDKARALQDSLYAESIEVNRVAASALSPAERKRFVDYHHRLIGTLLPMVSDNRGASDGGRAGG
jgi:DNA-binding MarR family transcriptional regulator